MNLEAPIKTLVLSGGGNGGYCHLGALNVLFGEFKQSEIEVYSGTSVGAIIAFMLCLGVSCSDIMNHLLEDDSLVKGGSIFEFDLFEKYGLLDMDILKRKVLEMLEGVNVDENITFEELLAKTGKHFICTASNIAKREGVYFSPKKTPGSKCLDAVMASSCLPIIFHAQKITGDHYVDGGLSDNFPYKYTAKYCRKLYRQTSTPFREGNMFGILLFTKNEVEISTFVGFIYNLVQTTLHAKKDLKKFGPKGGYRNVMVIYRDPGMNRYELFDAGMSTCRDFLV